MFSFSARGLELQLLVIERQDIARAALVEGLRARISTSVQAFESWDAYCRSDSEVTPDVLVLDLDLTHENPLELCRHLRLKSPHLILMVISGNGRIDHRAAAIHAGADAYFLKPVLMGELTESIGRLAARQASRSSR